MRQVRRSGRRNGQSDRFHDHFRGADEAFSSNSLANSAGARGIDRSRFRSPFLHPYAIGRSVRFRPKADITQLGHEHPKRVSMRLNRPWLTSLRLFVAQAGGQRSLSFDLR